MSATCIALSISSTHDRGGKPRFMPSVVASARHPGPRANHVTARSRQCRLLQRLPSPANEYHTFPSIASRLLVWTQAAIRHADLVTTADARRTEPRTHSLDMYEASTVGRVRDGAGTATTGTGNVPQHGVELECMDAAVLACYGFERRCFRRRGDCRDARRRVRGHLVL